MKKKVTDVLLNGSLSTEMTIESVYEFFMRNGANWNETKVLTHG